ncbi:MAG: MarC family protein [Lentisphaeria bacterium]|nr:MarC family protein [Lentisphaeria bacterium]
MVKFLMLTLHILILLNPSAVLSTFLALTANEDERTRKNIVLRSAVAVLAAGIILYFSGTVIFNLFGINIDVFRIGGGVILMVCAIKLVLGDNGKKEEKSEAQSGDIAVVPLAIPMAVGPGTSAGLIVIGMEKKTFASIVFNLGAIALAAMLLTALLLAGTKAERTLGKRGIAIITKLTGLFLSALAAGMILEGVKNFFS